MFLATLIVLCYAVSETLEDSSVEYCLSILSSLLLPTRATETAAWNSISKELLPLSSSNEFPWPVFDNLELERGCPSIPGLLVGIGTILATVHREQRFKWMRSQGQGLIWIDDHLQLPLATDSLWGQSLVPNKWVAAVAARGRTVWCLPWQLGPPAGWAPGSRRAKNCFLGRGQMSEIRTFAFQKALKPWGTRSNIKDIWTMRE